MYSFNAKGLFRNNKAVNSPNSGNIQTSQRDQLQVRAPELEPTGSCDSSQSQCQDYKIQIVNMEPKKVQQRLINFEPFQSPSPTNGISRRFTEKFQNAQNQPEVVKRSSVFGKLEQRKLSIKKPNNLTPLMPLTPQQNHKSRFMELIQSPTAIEGTQKKRASSNLKKLLPEVREFLQSQVCTHQTSLKYVNQLLSRMKNEDEHLKSAVDLIKQLVNRLTKCQDQKIFPILHRLADNKLPEDFILPDLNAEIIDFITDHFEGYEKNQVKFTAQQREYWQHNIKEKGQREQEVQRELEKLQMQCYQYELQVKLLKTQVQQSNDLVHQIQEEAKAKMQQFQEKYQKLNDQYQTENEDIRLKLMQTQQELQEYKEMPGLSTNKKEGGTRNNCLQLNQSKIVGAIHMMAGKQQSPKVLFNGVGSSVNKPSPQHCERVIMDARKFSTFQKSPKTQNLIGGVPGTTSIDVEQGKGQTSNESGEFNQESIKKGSGFGGGGGVCTDSGSGRGKQNQTIKNNSQFSNNCSQTSQIDTQLDSFSDYAQFAMKKMEAQQRMEPVNKINFYQN